MPRVTDRQYHRIDLNALPHGGSRGCARGTVAWFVKSLIFLSWLATGCASHVLSSGTPESVGIEASILPEIDSIAKQEIDSGNIPGCVVLVARKGTVVWHKAYGDRAILPEKVSNSLSTVFDLASLTKPVATTTAIALLLDDGKLNLDNKVTDYLPSFGAEGKDNVTLAHLLTHTSGLKPYLDMSLMAKKYGPGPNPDAIIEHICSLPRSYETSKSSVYSCLNFVILARIAEEVSGEPMHQFLSRRVWLPLGMKDTRFFLNDEQKKRAAPTHPSGSEDYRGRVHDPLARYYITPKHACGNAGLFSTADDLAVFAQMLLNRGEYGDVRILKPETVDLLTTAQTSGELPKRGLGWDIDSPYAPSARGDVIPPDKSFGHTGFTGTSLWLDRKSQTFFIILSNRTHMEKGAVGELRRGIANVVGRSLDIYREKPRPPIPDPNPWLSPVLQQQFQLLQDVAHVRPLPVDFVAGRASHELLLRPEHERRDSLLDIILSNRRQRGIAEKTPREELLRRDLQVVRRKDLPELLNPVIAFDKEALRFPRLRGNSRVPRQEDSPFLGRCPN